MKKWIFLHLLLIISLLAMTQPKDSLAFNSNTDDLPNVDINELFELKADSIERRVTINKRGTDTNHYLHFQVKNISIDTLIFKTNTCFYYNHSALTVGNLTFDLNASGGCYMNSHNVYRIAPGESFAEAQWITDLNLNKLQYGVATSTLSVPIVKGKLNSYCVDGRGLIEKVQYLSYEGTAKVTQTVIDERKRRKKKKG